MHWRIFWLNISQNLAEDSQYLQNYLLKSLKWTLKSLHELFVNSYGYNYYQNKDFIEKFLHELESYMLGNRQNIALLVDDFFDGLLIRVLRVMLFAKSQRDLTVADCIASKLKPLKPFDQAPEMIRSIAIRAFPPARILRNGLLLGNHVVQFLSKATMNYSCINEWIKLRYCNLCSALIQPLICRHSCFDRLSACLIFWTAFDKYWLSFIDQLVRVTERLKDSKSFPQVIRPLQIHISDAVMNLQTTLFRMEQSDELFSNCLPEKSDKYQSFLFKTDVKQRQRRSVYVDQDALFHGSKQSYFYENHDILKSWADNIHNKYLQFRKPFSAIIKYFCSEDLLRDSGGNKNYFCWTGDKLIQRSNVTLRSANNQLIISSNPIAIHIIKDLQHITEMIQSVVENNTDPNYMPIEVQINYTNNNSIDRQLSSNLSTNSDSKLITPSYFESKVSVISQSQVYPPSSSDHIKTPFHFNKNHIETSRFSVKKEVNTDEMTYFNPPRYLWLPLTNTPLFTYHRKIIRTFHTNSDNICRLNSSYFICIYSMFLFICQMFKL
ncbi:Glypican-4 isoform 2 [Schistosoma japonicum]|nr:Glypican-4 isoform 2 [Schistosoma japonicum]TNN06431.1 Glypican-4 isoform 2 [Schistosoma japonicum]